MDSAFINSNNHGANMLEIISILYILISSYHYSLDNTVITIYIEFILYHLLCKIKCDLNCMG